MAFAASIATIPLYSRGGIKLSTKSKSYQPIRIRARLRSESSYKVAIIGAGGDVGQPLSLLIKMSPFVKSLGLYDTTPTTVRTMAENLNHCNTPCHVSDFSGTGLAECVSGADVVVVVSRFPVSSGVTEEDSLRADVGAVKKWVEAVAEIKDENALVHVVSNSVESTVPVAAEVLKKRGVYDPRRLFGVTTLDVIRASTFVAKHKKGLKMIDVSVPVVGGNGGSTALPLLSKMRPHVDFTEQEAAELTARVRGAEREVVDAKRGQGCATLSTAYAVARFIESSLRALDGDDDVYECAFVESSVTELPFFGSRVKLGKDGVEVVVESDLEGMSTYEEAAFEALKPELKTNIEKGLTAASYL